jgi:hypothetical protein
MSDGSAGRAPSAKLGVSHDGACCGRWLRPTDTGRWFSPRRGRESPSTTGCCCAREELAYGKALVSLPLPIIASCFWRVSSRRRNSGGCRPKARPGTTLSCVHVFRLLFPAQRMRSYWFHELDLAPSPEQLFQSLHKSSIQRKVRRAEKEGLSYEADALPPDRRVLPVAADDAPTPQPFSPATQLVR